LTLPKDPAFDKAWNDWPQRDGLVEACHGDADLAKLIYRVNGDGSLAWLDSRPGVLEGKSPRKMLATERGRDELRAALWKFPYI
jgi:hypothetical protein